MNAPEKELRVKAGIDHDQEREQVRLPGGSYGVGALTVATANEKELRDCLEKDLTDMAQIMAQEALIGSNMRKASLTREGLASPEWHEYARKHARGMRNTISVVDLTERRIRAIRAELPRREALHKLDVKTKAEETRRRLEGVVEHAPVYAGNLKVKASENKEAWARLERFMLDVQLVASSVPYVENAYSTLIDGATRAAKALGVPAPEFDPLPQQPSKVDVDRLMGILRGARKGFDRAVPNIGDAANVHELVRELNKK
jgi:hypothetical protein